MSGRQQSRTTSPPQRQNNAAASSRRMPDEKVFEIGRKRGHRFSAAAAKLTPKNPSRDARVHLFCSAFVVGSPRWFVLPGARQKCRRRQLTRLFGRASIGQLARLRFCLILLKGLAGPSTQTCRRKSIETVFYLMKLSIRITTRKSPRGNPKFWVNTKIEMKISFLVTLTYLNYCPYFGNWYFETSRIV